MSAEVKNEIYNNVSKTSIYFHKPQPPKSARFGLFKP